MEQRPGSWERRFSREQLVEGGADARQKRELRQSRDPSANASLGHDPGEEEDELPRHGPKGRTFDTGHQYRPRMETDTENKGSKMKDGNYPMADLHAEGRHKLSSDVLRRPAELDV